MKPPITLPLLGIVILSLAASASAPRLGRLPPRKPKPVAETLSPEAEIQYEALRKSISRSTEAYMGLRRKDHVTDLPEPLYRRIAAIRPHLYKASELAGEKPPGRFSLIAVSDVTWKGREKATVETEYYSSGGAFCGTPYSATVTSSGWKVKPLGIGCGGWQVLRVCGATFVAYNGTSIRKSVRR